MGKKALTTTETKIIEAEDEPRVFVLSGGLFSGADVVYVRRRDAGEADLILSATGDSVHRLHLPAGRPLFAWTNLGTAELAYYLEEKP